MINCGVLTLCSELFELQIDCLMEKLLTGKLSVSLVMSPKALEEEGKTAAALSQDLSVTLRSLC